MFKRIAVVVAFAVAAAGPLSAQRPSPPVPTSQTTLTTDTIEPQPPVGESQATFRAEVNFVEVDTAVVDGLGKAVLDLRAEDFEVFEDGKRETISAFSRVDVPVERADRPSYAERPVEPDVVANEAREGRVYLVVLDDLQIDPMRVARVKALAREFIEKKLGANDLTAVVYTGGRSSSSQDFTNNRRLLLAAVDRLSGQKLTSATTEILERRETLRMSSDARNAGAERAPGADVLGDAREGLDAATQAINDQHAIRSRSVAGTIRRLAEFMASVHGRRKSMLLFSEGVDFDTTKTVGPSGLNASIVREDLHAAVAAASRGNVTIYPIDPRGLVAGDDGSIQFGGETPREEGAQAFRNEVRTSQDSLRTMAAETGGFAVVSQNTFSGAFDRIVAENSNYYLLGYYPTKERRNGKYRKLEVKVKRPGVRVIARNGYYEPDKAMSPRAAAPVKALSWELSEAIASPFPIAGLPIRVFAAPFKGESPNAAVALTVEVDASKLDFIQDAGVFYEKLEVVSTFVDSTGKVFPRERNTVTFTMTPKTLERTKAEGFRVISQPNLPPGRYQLRVAAGNASGRAGNVVYDLEIPDFWKQPLTMSGIALTSTAANEVPTAAVKNPLTDLLPGPPTSRRSFAVGDVITIFGEVYESGKTAAHTIAIHTELRADDGRVLSRAGEERSSAEMQEKAGGYSFTSRFPLTNVTPGTYILHVEAESQIGNRPTVSRDIEIRVK